MALPPALALAIALAMTAACVGSAPLPPPDPAGIDLARADVARATGTSAEAATAAGAMNAFGLDLYRAISGTDGNVVFSPSSIALAVAMARAGARGETAAEMDRVLHDLAAEGRENGINALDLALSERSGSFIDQGGEERDVTLRIANAPFAQRGMPLEQAYLEALATGFGAGLRLVDYIGATEDSRRLINGWVAGQTEDRIPELIGPGTLTPMTRLTLVNAIYLKAPWQTRFEPEATTDGTFTRLDGTTVQVPSMRTASSFRYAAGDGWRAVELPYVGGSLAMTIVVPEDLVAFEAALDVAALDALVAALEDRQVDLAFPKFGIETRAELARILGLLGMPTAFDEVHADFSGITTAEQLFISDVIHQANIDVDEAGTEAAAATAVVMRATSIPVDEVELSIDRPFLFLLRDLPTGAVVFMGRVADPSVGR